MQAGLRIDVDTYRGTREGVPRLLEMLDEAQVKATFFFSVGPDNMGRHLWRLIRPQFLWKMLRSNAAGLYGWDILLAGTAWPGKPIGRDLGHLMRQTRRAGHEVGLHAWDHHGWQANAGRWSDAQLIEQIRQGVDTLSDILGAKHRVLGRRRLAGGRACDRGQAGLRLSLQQRLSWPRSVPSDIGDGGLGAPQIPVDLPTFDEVVGPAVAAKDFNAFILDRFILENLNVYTVHAEVEGILMADDFRQLLADARQRDIRFQPSGRFVAETLDALPVGRVVRGALDGREGWLGVQGV